jgi:hypothetical protein
MGAQTTQEVCARCSCPKSEHAVTPKNPNGAGTREGSLCKAFVAVGAQALVGAREAKR